MIHVEPVVVIHVEPNEVSVRVYHVCDVLIEMFCTVLSLLSPLQLERPYRSTSLSPEFHYRDDLPPFLCESESGSDSSTSTPGTPIETHANLQSLLYRGVESREKMPTNIIYIDLLRPGSSIDDDGPFWTSPSQVTEERSLAEHGCRIIRATEYPRHLRDIDPTITLLSQSTSNARSHFTVHLRDRLMFSESTKLELVDPSTSNVDGFLYKTLLVPGYWDTISQSPGMSIESPQNLSSKYIAADASQYTITQRVVQDSCSISSPPSMIFSAVYKFLYQTSTPTVENFAISHMLTAEPHVQNEEFCLDDLLTMDAFSDALSDALSDTEAYTDIMAFVKPPDFFDEVEMDFTLESLESEQCSPDHSAFSSPGQYPQLVDVVPDELLLPASSFEFRVDTPNYVSNYTTCYLKNAYG